MFPFCRKETAAGRGPEAPDSSLHLIGRAEIQSQAVLFKTVYLLLKSPPSPGFLLRVVRRAQATGERGRQGRRSHGTQRSPSVHGAFLNLILTISPVTALLRPGLPGACGLLGPAPGREGSWASATRPRGVPTHCAERTPSLRPAPPLPSFPEETSPFSAAHPKDHMPPTVPPAPEPEPSLGSGTERSQACANTVVQGA